MVVNRSNKMGARGGGGGRASSGGGGMGMRNGLSAYDRDNLAMFRRLGHPKAEIDKLAADIRRDNAKNASTVSGVSLTKTGKSQYTLTWNDSSTSNGAGGSIAFSASAAKAKVAANTIKQTGSGRKALFAINN